jgi:very-short-patch-repair endonuclease
MKTVKVGSTKLTGHRVEKFKVPGNERELAMLAARLANRPTKSEKAVRHHLTKLGYDFKFQHPLHGYVIDFYFPQRSVAVEIDGKWHRKNPDRDVLRDGRLLKYGIRTLRIESALVFVSMKTVLGMIKQSVGSPQGKRKQRRNKR